jgi:predicted histidine transporter YuiF (NhaC family)
MKANRGNTNCSTYFDIKGEYYTICNVLVNVPETTMLNGNLSDNTTVPRVMSAYVDTSLIGSVLAAIILIQLLLICLLFYRRRRVYTVNKEKTIETQDNHEEEVALV